MKVEDRTTTEENEGESEPSRTSDEGSRANGASDGGPFRVAAARPAEAEKMEQPEFRRSRLLRAIYWGAWFILAPVLLACLLIWALTPPSGVEPAGVFGLVKRWVREQPVPMGIVIFTLFEMAFWAARHYLPLAKHAHPPLRADIPGSLRGPFERARALLDEAEMILQKHEKAIVRDLTAKEREKLKEDLESLRAAMQKTPFEEDTFVDALVKADGEVDIRLGRWRKSEVREYVEAIVMAMLVAFALRAFVIEAFKIPSGSMIPTLQVGDHIFVNKFAYGPAIPFTHKRFWTSMPPKRGDVMVFIYPDRHEGDPPQDFIKRVIALPGDKLEAKNGHPWINGWEVPYCKVGTYTYVDQDSMSTRHEGELDVEFLADEAYLTFYDRAQVMFPEYQGPFMVKPGEVWVMGDNRNNSHDSRMWFGGQGGGAPYENIHGRAMFVWLSVSDAGIDWSRFGAPVMGRPRIPDALKPTLAEPLDKCLREQPPIEKTTPPPPAPR